MKVKELIEMLGDHKNLYINGKKCSESLLNEMLDKEIKKINIEIEEKKPDLESLGYSFEVGM